MNTLIDFFGKFLRLQWILFIVMALVAALGVFFIESATHMNPSLQLRDSAHRQLTWMGVAVCVFFVTSLINYRLWIRFGWALYLAAIAILLSVLAFGVEINNSKSWIQIGSQSVQPAELCKIAFIIAMAWLIHSLRSYIKRFWPLILFVIVTLIPIALILKQPDLGSAAVFGPICFCMLVVAGVRKRYLLIPVLAAIAGIYFSYWIVHRAEWNGTSGDLKRCIEQGTLMSMGIMPKPDEDTGLEKPVLPASQKEGMTILTPNQVNRIRTTFDADLDPQGAGWAVRQSLIAVGSGGWRGKGYKQGDQNIYGFLPQNTSHNDYIFPVIAEEFGFVGGASLVLAQSLLIIGVLLVGASTSDRKGSLICAGVAGLLFTHFFINVGMTIQLVPVTGIPLPFISYGGTFLVACMAGLGLVQSVWIHRHETPKKEHSRI
jgi:rod shape determining protein RodA